MPMSKRSFVVAALAITLHGVLAAGLCAQEPLPGLPVVPPAVPQPGLLAQPGMSQQDGGGGAGGGAAGAGGAMPLPNAPEGTTGKVREGRDLKSAVAAVTKLRWLDRFEDARMVAAASGKPILFLQALGDLEGFA
jgi:hypothetical protein